MPELIGAVASVWSLSSVAVALLGGGATGAVLGRNLAPNPAYVGRVRLVIGFAVLGLVVVVFWTGQVLEALVSGDPFWYRSLSRALLNLLFIASLAVAGYLTPPRPARG